MKKLLGILVLGLFWCNLSFALTQQEAIDKHLSGRKLDSIEGVWSLVETGQIILYFKDGNTYQFYDLTYPRYDPGRMQKGSDNYYYGRGAAFSGYDWDNPMFGSKTISINGNSAFINLIIQNQQAIQWTQQRIWPSDIKSYNAKFDKGESGDKFVPSSGTAFFVTNKGHLITNYHVVEGCKNKSKISFEDKEIEVKLLAKDKYLDLALLKADIKNKNFIKVSNKAPEKLQRIIAAGYPLGKELSDDLKFTSGIVSSLKGLEDDSTRIQIDAALNPGNSGGPIVDEKNGELIAVAVSGLKKTQSINFGIKAGSVKNFLESNQISSLSQSNYSFGSVDLSDILENTTVYTFCK